MCYVLSGVYVILVNGWDCFYLWVVVDKMYCFVNELGFFRNFKCAFSETIVRFRLFIDLRQFVFVVCDECGNTVGLNYSIILIFSFVLLLFIEMPQRRCLSYFEGFSNFNHIFLR